MNALVRPPILTRDDLSFTQRDDCGRLINWPRNNPGVATDTEKGKAYFDTEIAELAGSDEISAYHAIKHAIISMSGHYTCLEIGFADSVARAALLGLRAMRGGEAPFEPIYHHEDQCSTDIPDSGSGGEA